ncbi:ketosteroid isomerase-related protein [Calidithermus chliarophilus]|uniref:ketosteroid isomerase-related protein n=1 Tax=Calidithermus chliarophilus TaxID=52023 RepID=UPI0004863B49|nr:ketosteroid isomerase-related protein [Calidithermus chliarophilus]
MNATPAETLLRVYYDRFNARDVEGFLQLLSNDVVHEISQGPVERGKEAFRAFLERMNRCYLERVYDLAVMVSADGRRAAAEFMLEGEYLETDGSLPPARGQRYTLRVGAFFEIRGGKIARVSNHYNLQDWIRQVA